MKRTESYAVHLRNNFSDEKKIKTDLNTSMFCRYALSIFAVLFLYIFRKRLPFPFPGFMFVSGSFLLWNALVHALSLKKSWLKRIYPLVPYSDTLVAPFVFQFSGGFLSPFVITHIVTSLGSNLMYTDKNNIPRHSAIILSVSYLSVALLQKFGVLPCGISYVQTMMSNNFFFFFVVSITTSVIISCLLLVEMLNIHALQMLDEMTQSFDSILKGTISVVGQDFYIHLARHLSQSLSATCVIAAELADKGGTIRSLAVWKDGKIGERFESPVSGTIFAEVLSQQSCLIEENTESLYLNNPLLEQCRAIFFFGAILNDSKGNAIGILCLINDKPMRNMYLVKPLVSIFASRAAAELERKINEEKQKFVEIQLAHAHKMSAIGQLVSGIAHDFNNMVSAISGCAQLLHNKISQESPHQRYIKHILDASKHTSDLIGQLTRFARREKPDSASVDVNKAVGDIIELLRGTIPKKITLRNDCCSTPLFALGDATQLANVLLNIGINARDAMDEMLSGVLSFSTSTVALEKNSVLCQSFRIEAGDYAVISVSDTGTGMSKETLDHMFEPFFTTKPKGKGTGLGLANVWAYIENYKGAIEINSQLGAGSTFSFYFPLVTAKSSTKDNNIEAPGASKHMVSVLIIDDDPAIRLIVSEILANNEYTAFTAEDGEKALSFIRENPSRVDLAILDMIMPGLNGRDTFFELRKINPDLKILMISGIIDPKAMADMLNKQGTSFLAKPFSDNQLLSAVSAFAPIKIEGDKK